MLLVLWAEHYTPTADLMAQEWVAVGNLIGYWPLSEMMAQEQEAQGC